MPANRMSEKERIMREKAAEKRRLEYVTPEWTSTVPKPVFDPTIWPDPETCDALANYEAFHTKYPHSVTPRPLDDVLVKTGKNLILASPRTQLMTYTDEANVEAIKETGKPLTKGAELVSYGSGVRITPLSPEFHKPMLGIHGTFARVAKVSEEFQRNAINAATYDCEDPWYKQSVKDGLETYHIDGDHTSVRLKPPKQRIKSAATLKFEAEAKWKAEQYALYQGGAPVLGVEQQAILNGLAVSGLGEMKRIAGPSPWEDQYKWTEFNANGTLLNDFNQVDLERKLKNALEAHEELLLTDERRRAQARADRIAAKKKLLGLSTPTPANSKPGTAGFGSRMGTAPIHPMMDGIAEGNEANGDLFVQDLDGNETFDGMNSVSSMGGMTYQDMEGTVNGGGGGTIDGDSTVLGSEGSTYRHKKHGGDDISALNINALKRSA